jgi:hypothetical protein
MAALPAMEVEANCIHLPAITELLSQDMITEATFHKAERHPSLQIDFNI